MVNPPTLVDYILELLYLDPTSHTYMTILNEFSQYGTYDILLSIAFLKNYGFIEVHPCILHTCKHVSLNPKVRELFEGLELVMS